MVRKNTPEVTDADRARFETLYRQHVRSVLRYALARVPSDQANDVVADTFLVAWRRLREVPPEPLGWLLAVARNVLATHARSGARRAALGVKLAGHSGGELVDDVAEQSADRQCVLQAFARLNEVDREVLRLVAWDSLTRDQAARALGVSRLSFGVRLHRARRRFAAELAALEVPGSSPVRPRRAPDHHSVKVLQAKEAH